MRVVWITLVLARLAILLSLLFSGAMMANRASNRCACDRVMPSQVAYYGPGGRAGKATCLRADAQSEADQQSHP